MILRFLFCFSLLFSCISFAQDSIRFQFQTWPNSTFTKEITYSAQQEIVFSGEEELLDELRKNGGFEDTTSYLSVKTLEKSTMQERGRKGTIPYHSALYVADPDRAFVFELFREHEGTIPKGSTLEKAQLANQGAEEWNLNTDFLNEIGEIQQSLKTGDTIVVQSDYKLDMSGMSITSDMMIRYELLEVYDGKAYLKYTIQLGDLDVDSDLSVAFVGEGHGEGVIEYVPEYGYIAFAKGDIHIHINATDDYDLRMDLTVVGDMTVTGDLTFNNEEETNPEAPTNGPK